MKDRREIVVLVTLASLGFVFLAGFFVLKNCSAFPLHTEVFSPGTGIVNAKPAATAPNEMLVNINTATAEHLQTLPGIGPALAQRIISYRAENGPFASVAELTKVQGIGIKRLENLLGYITTGA